MKDSLEYNKYIKKLRLDAFKVIFCQIILLILFIIIWQILSDKGIVNQFYALALKK